MTKKIEKLTLEQGARLPEFREKWTAIGLSTDPADRPAAELAIKFIYQNAGLNPPQKIVWCGSPMSQGIVRAIVLDNRFQGGTKTSVRASVGASVRNSVWDSVRASVRNSVWDSVQASVQASVWDSVWDSVGASVRNSVWDSVGDSVQASVRDSVQASVWASVQASVQASVWASVRASVRASVQASVQASVRDSVRNSVWDSVRASVRNSVWQSCYGNHDAHWLGFYDFFREAVSLKKETEKISGLIAQAKAAGWFLPYQNICWVSERPNIMRLDDRGRLHCTTGPALTYPDGWAIYSVHGIRVPEEIIENPSSLTVEKIENEVNAEIRRVMIDLYGPARYLLDTGAQVVDQCPADHPMVGLRTAKLLRKEVPDDETIVYIDLLNSTPEPDGSVRRYQLRVDPTAYGGRAGRECLAAAASTWRKRSDPSTLFFEIPEKYSPVVES